MTAPSRPRRWPCAAALLAACLAVGPAWAGDRPDHDRARAALQAGEVLPLQKVLEKVQRLYPGELLEVELEREDGLWVYELKILQAGGRRMRLEVDARTGEVLRRRPHGRPHSGARPAASAGSGSPP